MLFIVGKEAWGAVAVVHDFVTGGLEALDESGGAQGGRRFFASQGKGGGAGRRANQGNLLRLTDDFDRQGVTPCTEYRVSDCRADITVTGTEKIHRRRFSGPARRPLAGNVDYKLLAARRRRDGRQFRRQGEAYILAD